MNRQLMHDAFTTMQTEIEQAQRLIQQDELIKAEEIYHKMLEQEKDFPPALHGLSVLANKIEEQEVRENLLDRAIQQIKETEDRNQKAVLAIWLTEQAEALIKLDRQDEAKNCIAESERFIKENLS